MCVIWGDIEPLVYRCSEQQPSIIHYAHTRHSQLYWYTCVHVPCHTSYISTRYYEILCHCHHHDAHTHPCTAYIHFCWETRIIKSIMITLRHINTHVHTHTIILHEHHIQAYSYAVWVSYDTCWGSQHSQKLYHTWAVSETDVSLAKVQTENSFTGQVDDQLASYSLSYIHSEFLCLQLQ